MANVIGIAGKNRAERRRTAKERKKLAHAAERHRVQRIGRICGLTASETNQLAIGVIAEKESRRPSWWEDHCAFCSGPMGKIVNVEARHLLICETCGDQARSQPIMKARGDLDILMLVSKWFPMSEPKRRRHLGDRALLFEHYVLAADFVRDSPTSF